MRARVVVLGAVCLFGCAASGSGDRPAVGGAGSSGSSSGATGGAAGVTSAGQGGSASGAGGFAAGEGGSISAGKGGASGGNAGAGGASGGDGGVGGAGAMAGAGGGNGGAGGEGAMAGVGGDGAMAGAGGTSGGGNGGGGNGGGAGGSAPVVDCGSVVVEGDIGIHSEEDLAELAGVTEVTGAVSLVASFPATDLSGLSSLRCVGGLSLFLTPVTSTLGLDNLQSATLVTIQQNPDLSRIEGFPALVRSMNVTILDNPVLTEIDAFDALPSGGLHIREQPLLTSISGFTALREVPNPGLLVSDNAALVDIGGFPNLDLVWSFTLVGNAVLNDLSGLAGLRTVETVMHVSGNASLSSFDGLTSLEAAETLRVRNNPMLPDCETEALIARMTVTNAPIVEGNLGDACTP